MCELGCLATILLPYQPYVYTYVGVGIYTAYYLLGFHAHHHTSGSTAANIFEVFVGHQPLPAVALTAEGGHASMLFSAFRTEDSRGKEGSIRAPRLSDAVGPFLGRYISITILPATLDGGKVALSGTCCSCNGELLVEAHVQGVF
jgi:hypothetical protein